MELIKINDTTAKVCCEIDGIFELYKDNNLIIRGEKEATFAYDPNTILYELVINNTTYQIGYHYLPQSGVINFRDLGGIFTVDHKQVKFNCFYRSAPLNNLNIEQITFLNGIGLKSILDFRSSPEIKDNEDSTFENCTYYHYSGIKEFDNAFNGNFNMADLVKTAKSSVLKDFMCKTYLELPFNNSAYQKMFELIQNKQVPLVFHCSAGKDRTGIGAALILLALGVSRDEVMKDYLESNIYRKNESEKLLSFLPDKAEVIQAVMGVFPEYLDTSLDAILAKYNNFETYFKAEFDLNTAKLEELRKLYLY